jgi:intracellular multiplication protein IcmF
MDQSLRVLCDALKKIIRQLKPQQNEVSFTLLTGQSAQGKTTLLQQSHYNHLVVHAERGADIFYNHNSVILELGQAWLSQSTDLLQYTLKQLNHCHRTIKISSLILCIDINELFLSEPTEFMEKSKHHAQFFERFGLNLGYRVDASIVFTKVDAVAGFCDYFQSDHLTDLNKPLGFSLNDTEHTGSLSTEYKTKFDHFIETLGQHVIHKIHPERSSIKRSLIREFPLQLAYLRAAILTLIQRMPPDLFRINALYFTSAEQGHGSLDRLNKKIQHEYGLTVQDYFPQSTNHKAYFIEGALTAVHTQTRQYTPPTSRAYQWTKIGLAGLTGLSLLWIGHHYMTSSDILDTASKELFAYDALNTQPNKQTEALSHLHKASNQLDALSSIPLTPHSFIDQLKKQVHANTNHHLKERYLPRLLAELEQTITDNKNPPVERYDALKIYVMLGNPAHFSQKEVETWFHTHWQQTQKAGLMADLALLNRTLKDKTYPISINQQIVSDARNYLNALPATYLYYALAKRAFSTEKQTLSMDGFLLANTQLPTYLTKKRFPVVIAALPDITTTLQSDNWVLARQDINHLQDLLQKAYCDEYVSWWQNFIQKTMPLHTQTYQQTRDLTHTLHHSQAITALITTFQQQLSPDDSTTNSALFNQEIASKFTTLSLISQSALRNLNETLDELEPFLGTLAIVNDHGKMAFNLAQARFDGDTLNNPLSTLYHYSQHLPAPVSTWAKQIADDTWFSLMNDSKQYINHQWKKTVFRDYKKTISKRYPFNATATEDIDIADFDRFFSTHGELNTFINQYLKAFLNTSQPQWALKESNSYVLPISSTVLNELIRANIITNMFFPKQRDTSNITFSLQKLNLDPVVGQLRLSIGEQALLDTQTSDSFAQFNWPSTHAKLTLKSIEGQNYELEESGSWAFFKILQKVNVLLDEDDPASLQILFEINGNSGRYLLKTDNEVNPFTPGILNGFHLPEVIV